MKQSILLALALCLAGSASFAQGIVNAELNAAPMAVNPACTGMFNGTTRVNSFYTNHWAGADINYMSYGASVDLPLVTGKGGSYLAAGMQLRKDEAGDGNLNNFSGLISVAYHKIFRRKGDSNNAHAADLAIGLQAGYEQNSISLSSIYFGSHWVDPNNYYLPPTGSIEYGLGIGNTVNYYPVNAGISFAKSFSERFNLVAGVSADNLNQPARSTDRWQNNQLKTELQYMGSLGLKVLATKRLSLRPAVYYMTSANSNGVIAGNDFGYNLSKNPKATESTSVFLGFWYRSVDVPMVTAGVTHNRLHLGIAYDYLPHLVKTPSNGSGGLCVNLRYTAPGKSTKKRVIPGDRF